MTPWRDKARKFWPVPLILLAVVNVCVFSCKDTRLFFDKNRLSGVNRPSSVDDRFAALRRLLPERGIVGYLTLMDNQNIQYHVDASGAYYKAQYALAPVVLDNSPHHALVVGNFPQGTAQALIMDRLAGYTVLHDSGDGVMLLSREF